MTGQLNDCGVQAAPKAPSPTFPEETCSPTFSEETCSPTFPEETCSPNSTPIKSSSVSVYDHQIQVTDLSPSEHDFPPELVTIRNGQQVRIRPFERNDFDDVWAIMEPVLRAGGTYSQPQDLSKEDALEYWIEEWEHCYVVEVIQPEDMEMLENIKIFDTFETQLPRLIATYTLRRQNNGGGSHVCNAGYMVHPEARHCGVGTAICVHSMQLARTLGFKAMQYNFVISSNERAVRLWTSMGFQIVGRLPKAFKHETFGYVDAFVMYQWL